MQMTGIPFGTTDWDDVERTVDRIERRFGPGAARLTSSDGRTTASGRRSI